MYCTLKRVLIGRMGQTFLILTALGLLWTAWWIWPERPLRVLSFERLGQFDEFAHVSQSGRSMYITSPVDRSKSRIISLRTGLEVSESNEINNPTFNSDWQVAAGTSNKPKFAFLPIWLQMQLGLDRRSQRTFDILDKRGLSISRTIPADRWCGFAENNRGWTQDSWPEPRIVLHEWDISFPRQPVWLWLITGGTVVFLIGQWRRSKTAGR